MEIYNEEQLKAMPHEALIELVKSNQKEIIVPDNGRFWYDEAQKLSAEIAAMRDQLSAVSLIIKHIM